MYVHPSPNIGDARWQVSSEGGVGPARAHSGSELLQKSGPADDVPGRSAGSTFIPGDPSVPGDRGALFSVQLFFPGTSTRAYDVAPDERFVMVRSASDEGLGQIVVVENLFEELFQRMGN